MSDLKDAKVGDEVIITNRLDNNCIAKIEAITPKGFIKVKGCLYNSDGRMRTSDAFSRSYIRLATEEDKAELAKKKVISSVLYSCHNLKEISYEQAVAIKAILKNQI